MIEIEHLQKSFGSQVVLDDVSLTIEEHQIFGLIGKNGAGKTTLMKLLLGLLKADQGKIYLDGQLVVYNKPSSFLGYVPDVGEYYGFLNAEEYMALCASLTNTSKERCKELLELVGLGGVTKRISKYSRGMKQRLGIAQALINDPKILLCDEPTSALDPQGRKEILDLLLSLKDRMTILLSTHILSDVERVCDGMAILDQGRILRVEQMEKLFAAKRTQTFVVEFVYASDIQRFMHAFPTSSQKTAQTVECRDLDEFSVMKFLLEEKIAIVSMAFAQPNLEDVFMEVIGHDACLDQKGNT